MSSYTNTSLLIIATTAAILGIWAWKRKKNKVYVRVGKIGKLFFYPVKSLKAVEVNQGLCTKQGFVVNGVLDRTFMVVDGKKAVVSQKQAPRLVLLTPEISGNYLSISGPDVETLKVEIKKAASPDDKVIDCRIYGDIANAIDCGETAANWIQSFLNMPDIRLMQYIPSLPHRKPITLNPYFKKFKGKAPIGFQNKEAFHVLSQPSIDDLNVRLEEKISVLNFRPNILAEGCEAYAEDNWKYIKFSHGVELMQTIPNGRCLVTTVKPDKGIITMKDPLATLRKYRMSKDPEFSKAITHTPLFGICCILESPGEIKVGDEIYASIEEATWK